MRELGPRLAVTRFGFVPQPQLFHAVGETSPARKSRLCGDAIAVGPFPVTSRKGMVGKGQSAVAERALPTARHRVDAAVVGEVRR